jgi:hypothetical protein
MLRTHCIALWLVSTLASVSSVEGGTLLFNLNDVTTGGLATAFPANTPVNEAPAMAFDDIRTTKGLIFNTGDVTAATPVIWTYDFAGVLANRVVQYSLTSANDAPDRDPRDFFLEGSNDGSLWTIVDTVTGHAFLDQPTVGDNTLPSGTDQTRFETYLFSVDAPAAFQQYRLRIIETFGTTNDRPQIAEFQMFNEPVPEPSTAGLVAIGTLICFKRRRS